MGDDGLQDQFCLAPILTGRTLSVLGRRTKALNGTHLIHSFIILEYDYSVCWVPGIILDTGDTEPKQTEPLPSQSSHSSEDQ